MARAMGPRPGRLNWAGGARIEFDIDFQFKSRLLEGLLKANFHHAVERLMGCFEDRAKALYG